MMNVYGHCTDEAFWSKSKSKILFVPTSETFPSVSGFFKVIKSLNFVLIPWKNESGIRLTTEMASILLIVDKELKMSPPSTDVEIIFPDKLRNLKQFCYKAAGRERKPKLFRRNGTIYGYDLFFMDLVAKKQNANYSVDIYANSTNYVQLMTAQMLDINLDTINLGFLSYVRKYYKTVNTFDTEGYCALIPIPPRNSFFKYILSPYDWMSWMFMLLSVTFCAVIWKIFKSHRSGRSLNGPGYVIFGLIANFLGQSNSIRHSRWYHALIIQIFAFIMLILGNAYQSLLISLLTVSRNGTRITTVNEMMEGNYHFMYDRMYFLMITEGDLANSVKNISNIIKEKEIQTNHKSMAEHNNALVIRCDTAHDLIYSRNYEYNLSKPSDYFYILPEKLLTMSESYMTGRFSPFTERLEEISLQVFESGIKQHWKTLMQKLTDQIDLDVSYFLNEDYMLKINDLKYVFFIYGIGLLIALAIFLFELIVHKYYEKISQEFRKIVEKITQKSSSRVHTI